MAHIVFLLESSGLEQTYLGGVWGPWEPIPTELYRNTDYSNSLALAGQKFQESAEILT